MDPKLKAVMLDAILRKFEGDKTFTWKKIHEKEWYKDIDKDFYVVENMIKYLLADDALVKISYAGYPEEMSQYKLSPKGFAMLGDSENDSYLSRYLEKKKLISYNKQILVWAIVAAITGLVSIIISILK